uniref:Latent transforming growth factor beta binding protein 4 n=1 Tax=Oreochromis aureus TaxID=47969 RepID=A0AAZ1X9C1_OREAU
MFCVVDELPVPASPATSVLSLPVSFNLSGSGYSMYLFCMQALCFRSRPSFGWFICVTSPPPSCVSSSSSAQSVISEEKGQCYRVLGSGLGPSSCSLPILKSITKQICCCSRVGKAWGPDCQRCPYFGSVAFKEICPAGPGYQYSPSTLKFNQRVSELEGGGGAVLVNGSNKDNQGTYVNECLQSPAVCSVGECVNSIGSYRCACPSGYRSNSQQTSCQDVNECRQNPCSNGRCENTPGSYRCVCHHGYKLQNNTCTDVDECAEPSQCPGQMCVNSVGSYRCVSCRAGFRLTDRQCTDINECEDGDSCPGQRCVNTEGSYRCVDCRQGYHSVDGVCTDIDECASGRACEAERVCVNTVGSFRCDCAPGYRTSGLGRQCRDINECLEGDFCFSRGECVNTPGSYTCVCSQGFTLSENRTACLDVDECVKAGVCSDGRCVNTEGSFQCECQIGFTTNPEGTACLDINECANTTVCGANAYCQNLFGTYRCVCDQGFTSSADGKTCAHPGELRECYYNLAERGTCSLLATNTTQQECCCTLGQGWGLGCQYHPCPTAYTAEFLTLCPSGNGYVTEGPGAFSYRDVDECKRFHPEVCKNGVCVNNIPGYSCYCSSGYVYNSTLLECVDHDECEEESCVGGICVNTVGSYYCSCQPPLVLDDTQRNCVNSSDLNEGKPELPHVTAGLMCQSALLGAQVTFTDCCCLYGQGWGMSCALCPPGFSFSHLSGRYESYASLSTAEDCGILHGCENGRCIRVAEGYTCDCYQGYELDMTTMTCIDVNECEDSVRLEFPCVNARCVNTDGSYRCVCRRGYRGLRWTGIQ